MRDANNNQGCSSSGVHRFLEELQAKSACPLRRVALTTPWICSDWNPGTERWLAVVPESKPGRFDPLCRVRVPLQGRLDVDVPHAQCMPLIIAMKSSGVADDAAPRLVAFTLTLGAPARD